MDEPYPLPAEWRWEPLEALAEVRTGVAKGRALGNSDTVQVPYLRVANVQNGYLDLDEVKTIEIRRSEIDRYSLKPNDVLFTEGGDRDKLGRGAVWKGEVEQCVHQNHVFAARLHTMDVLPGWISLASQAQYARDYFMEVARQTVNLASINATKLRSFPVPVPPLDEQRRVLAKYERLTSESRTAHKALDRVPALLKRFRQSVLAAAFRAEPTEHGPTLKSANESNGRSQLPGTWRWVKVREVGHVQLGRQRAPKYHLGPSMRPYLRVANVFEDRIDVSDVLEMNFSPEEYETYRLQYGDILLNEGQSRELVGRPAMYRDELPGACFQNTLVRFRAFDQVDPEYALYVFLHYLHAGVFSRIATRSVNIAHLGASRFADLEFPVAPLAEQRRVVERIRTLLSQVANIGHAVQAARVRTDYIDQAILARAFRGEL